MTWKINFEDRAIKQLAKLDRSWQKKILTFLDTLALAGNPPTKGKQLKGDKKDFWRYRVGDYRILCDIQDNQWIILVVVIDHRKNVYR